jgi:hypothetical protein
MPVSDRFRIAFDHDAKGKWGYRTFADLSGGRRTNPQSACLIKEAPHGAGDPAGYGDHADRGCSPATGPRWHIGGSCPFRLRDGRFRQITEDQRIGNLIADGDDARPVYGREAGPFS